jgi:lipoprotein-releasing system permease protein
MIAPLIFAFWFGIAAYKNGRNWLVWGITGAIIPVALHTIIVNAVVIIHGPFDIDSYPTFRIATLAASTIISILTGIWITFGRMLQLFLWRRYLGKKKVVALSVAAVGLSTALLIVVASLFTGFIKAFEQSAVDAIGDVIISTHAKITDYQELTGELEKLEAVEAATGTLSTQGLLHLGGGNVRAVEIWGIEVQKLGSVTGFERSLLKGKLEELKAPEDSRVINSFIGIGVLCEPNEKTDEYDLDAARAEIGREVVLTTGSTSLTTGGSTASAEGGGDVEGKDGNKEVKIQKIPIRLEISDVVITGAYYLDSRNVYVPIERLQKEISPKEKRPIAGQIEIKLKKGVDEEAALAQIRGVWRVFAEKRLGWDEYKIESARIETARQMQSRFMAEVRKQMGVLLLIFGVVSLSAVLLIFCIFYMIVETRRRDVAILKSCGATGGSIAIVFTGFGAFVGILGALVGTGLGYLITKNINMVEGWVRLAFGLKLWKASVYMFSRIPSEVDWHSVLWIALSAILGAAIGALVPAVSAALTRPVNVLRYE